MKLLTGIQRCFQKPRIGRPRFTGFSNLDGSHIDGWACWALYHQSQAISSRWVAKGQFEVDRIIKTFPGSQREFYFSQRLHRPGLIGHQQQDTKAPKPKLVRIILKSKARLFRHSWLIPIGIAFPRNLYAIFPRDLHTKRMPPRYGRWFSIWAAGSKSTNYRKTEQDKSNKILFHKRHHL